MSELTTIKKSFAWGQLVAGALIGSVAVWKLMMKVTNTAPSQWLAGLSATYEEIREFVMQPFAWLSLQLTPDEKNQLVILFVLLGALARAALQHSGFVTALGLSASLPVALWLMFAALGWSTEEGFIQGALSLVMFASIIWPFEFVFSSQWDTDEFRASALILLNVLFTVIWGAALLLLNWATA